MLIDSHCHVLSSEYENVDEIIVNSLNNGVDKLIINGYDLKSSKEAASLANKYKNVYAAVGIGPENIDNVDDNVIDEIKCLLDNEKVVAVGEIGLDYYWTTDNKEKQIEIFKKMVFLASSRKLPVIVHNRNATNDVYNILKESKVTGIIHCFSGSTECAFQFIRLGFLIGIGGVVTFKNSQKIKDVVKAIPISSISLETDSPYLSPEPYRGKRNDPAKIIYVARKIAELKNVDLPLVLKETGAVSRKFDLK